MEQEKPTKPETDRTFPEDDDTLYREMTVHMPRCYFPTSLGENSILKFAGEEFRRVKNIVCRRYNFNEDKYIRENAGVSPFDSVRGNFEQEVYRRLRKDYAHLSIISIRRSLYGENPRRREEGEQHHRHVLPQLRRTLPGGGISGV